MVNTGTFRNEKTEVKVQWKITAGNKKYNLSIE